MSDSLVNSSAVMALLAIPGTVIWSYSAGGVVLAIGLITIFLIAVVERASLDNGLNYLGDKPMFCGTVVAGAMPREA